MEEQKTLFSFQAVRLNFPGVKTEKSQENTYQKEMQFHLLARDYTLAGTNRERIYHPHPALEDHCVRGASRRVGIRTFGRRFQSADSADFTDLNLSRPLRSSPQSAQS